MQSKISVQTIWFKARLFVKHFGCKQRLCKKNGNKARLCLNVCLAKQDFWAKILYKKQDNCLPFWIQSKTFVKIFWEQSKTYAQTFWVQSNTFVQASLV